jgi:hypothetical protein
MRISEVRERVRAELLEFAWNEWAQMGLSGHTAREDRWAMDPEALLIFTLEVARRDPRLFDEVLDWVAENGNLLILRRVRNIQRRHKGDTLTVDAALAWAASANPALRWSIPVKRARERARERAQVFDAQVASFISDEDPVFREFGLSRPVAGRSHKSAPPFVRGSINFAFRMRLLFGVGSRAEVVRILLTTQGSELNAARIAEAAAFAKRNVNETLTSLLEAGTVKARWLGNERVFFASPERWARLLEVHVEDLPRFVPWVHLLPALTRILVWLEREVDDSWSEYVLASEARSLVESLTKDLEAAGMHLPSAKSFPGAEYRKAFERVIDNLLDTIQPARGRLAAESFRSG